MVACERSYDRTVAAALPYTGEGSEAVAVLELSKSSLAGKDPVLPR